MNLSQAADLIKQFEGFRPDAYQDSAGVWTIGYGDTDGVTENTPPTTEQAASARLDVHIKAAARTIASGVTAPLNDNQFAALCSLIFNIGAANFSASTLLKMLNQKQYSNAADQFLRWNKIHVNGVVQESEGLSNRRVAERELFLKA